MSDATDGKVRTGQATNGPVELHYEAYGDPTDPALLMVSGLGSQCITFVEPLLERFVEAGFFTIRYDNRDVGLSSKFAEVRPDLGAVVSSLKAGEAPSVPYLLSDMAADAAAVLDALDIEAAHVLGVSMGGMIVQTMAIERPERMLSMTSIMSTTGDRSVGRATAEANALLMTPAGPSREEAIERMILGARTYGSPDHIDEERLTEIAGTAFDRCFHPEGTARQLMAITASGDRTEKLRAVTVPALVIHGDKDNLIDVSGGVATADAIPGAKLAVLEGMGHDLPPAYWDRIVQLIADHAASATAG